MMETAISLLNFIPDKIFSNLIPFVCYLGFFCVICIFYYVVWKSKNSALTRILYTILISMLLLQFTLQEISSKQTQSRHRAYRLFFSFITIKVPDYSNAPEKSASLLKVLREWRTDENRDVMSLLNMICRQCPKSKSQNDPKEPKVKLPPDETPGKLPIIQASSIKAGPEIK